MKPLIGILLNQGSDASYSIYPWYAMRKDYERAIVEAGGVPVFIGHEAGLVDEYLTRLDGLVLTGGDFESPLECYDGGLTAAPDSNRYPRAHFEYQLVNKAYQQDVPVLGICAGMQQMNVSLGGTLLKSVPNHRFEDRKTPQHDIQLVQGTKLHQILGTDSLKVNSYHSEGIQTLARGLTLCARAEDGVIEAFEAPNHRFFIGVVWHPEFVIQPEEKRLWADFIHQAGGQA